MVVTVQQLQEEIDAALGAARPITLATYFLDAKAQKALKIVVGCFLERYDRMDLFEVVYSAAKELVINATKANVKRAVFRMSDLNPENPDEYEQGMLNLKDELREENLLQYEKHFRDLDLPVHATFYGNEQVLNIKVKNAFPLLPQEEERIREKFRQAQSFSSLIDFYNEFADETEGAGLGLTMVGILLDNTGIDKHGFTLYNNTRYNETAARLEIPLTDDYVPRRKLFDQEYAESDKDIETFRRDFARRYKIHADRHFANSAEST